MILFRLKNVAFEDHSKNAVLDIFCIYVNVLEIIML
jgi:hypothetical protein